MMPRERGRTTIRTSIPREGSHLSGTASTGVTYFDGLTQLKSYKVSALPTCNAGLANALVAVSDAASPSWNGILSGGGTGASANVLAFCNGTNWTAH